jgi:hypothetical protein
MKQFYLSLLIGVFILMKLGYTQTTKSMKPNATSDEAEIISVTKLLTQLMIERKTTEMNQIVDENFTLTHISGYVQSKKEWFSEIESERMKYYSAIEVKLEVSINGNKAKIISQNLLDARIWGSRNTWRLQQTMQLEKRSGKWIILRSLATTF